MVGEEPTIKASPILYDTYGSCIDGAARAMTSVYTYLPEELTEKVFILPMCTRYTRGYMMQLKFDLFERYGKRRRA